MSDKKIDDIVNNIKKAVIFEAMSVISDLNLLVRLKLQSEKDLGDMRCAEEYYKTLEGVNKNMFKLGINPYDLGDSHKESAKILMKVIEKIESE